jgi:sporulation protein YlmC with PRC-barrel domain
MTTAPVSPIIGGDRGGMGLRLELGRPVRCADGATGKLTDVVIDPVGKCVTHLVVQPEQPQGPTRLVPVELAREGDEGQEAISLRCTAQELQGLDNVEEFAYLRLGEFPVDDPKWDVGVQDVLAMPYYDASGLGAYPAEFDPNAGIAYDRVPKGEVEIRRASEVISTDGHHLGHVDGFLVDDEHITHLVLERGHLWGHREVTVPMGAITKVETDSVTLNLTKDEIKALPSRPVHRWRP